MDSVHFILTRPKMNLKLDIAVTIRFGNVLVTGLALKLVASSLLHSKHSSKKKKTKLTSNLADYKCNPVVPPP